MKNQKCAESRVAKSPVGRPLPGVPFDNGYHLEKRDRNYYLKRSDHRISHNVD